MPYKSEAQRRFMHVRHPEIARRWDAKYGGKIERRARRKVIARRARKTSNGQHPYA